MKKGIALFVTMMFLMIIITIISKIMGDYEKFITIDNRYISQNSILIKDSVESLNKLSQNIDNYNDLKKIFISFPISDDDFKVVYSITPIFSKIDINHKNIGPFLDNLMQFYDIDDPILFKNLIKDTIDKDIEERGSETEIILKNRFFQNGKIYNYRHFKEIMDYYYKITGDKNIYKIPWQKYIYFSNGNNNIVCEAMDLDLKKFLELEDIDCKDLNRSENRILENFDIISFDKNSSFWVDINIKYKQQNIDITYDIDKKKVIKIENNPIY